MSATDWSLSKENFHPSDSSLRDTSSHKSLQEKKSSSSVVDSDRRRPVLTSLHGSQPAITHGMLTAARTGNLSTASTTSSVREPFFHIYQDGAYDESDDQQNSFLEDTPGRRHVVPGSMTSTPEEPQRLPPPPPFSDAGSYSYPCEEDDDENKENVYPFSSPSRHHPALTAGVLVESRTVPFVPLDVQEMVLDEDEWEQNQDIFLQLSEELSRLHTTSTVDDHSRRWSV